MHNSAQLFRGAVVCGILLLGTAAARAQDKVDCKNAETQMDLDFCAGKDFDAVDAQLNKVYGTLAAKYGAGDKALLKTAEKAWLAYRDAECSYETADTVGGTINPMVETMCRTGKTKARVKELQTQLDCSEGDTMCNLPGKSPLR